jgi:hypothetical protein
MQRLYKFSIFLLLAVVVILGLKFRSDKQNDILNNKRETPKTKVRGKSSNIKNILDQKVVSNSGIILEANKTLESITAEIKSDPELIHHPAPAFTNAAIVIASISSEDINTQSKFFRTCKSNKKLNNTLRFICRKKLKALGL